VIPFPTGDENPASRTPVVTYSLIAANGAVFLAVNLLRGHGFQPTEEDLRDLGLLPGDPSPRRFLTSMFVHAGPMHLFGNMWFLHIFGDNVEDKLGRLRYLLLYLGWGAVASLAFLVFARPFGSLAGVDPELVRQWNELPLVGASGAISGVMGTYLVFFPRARIRMIVWILFVLTFSVPAILVIGLYFLQDLVLGALMAAKAAEEGRSLGGVAYAAHTGGMLAGVLTGFLLKPALRRAAGAGSWDRDTGFAPGEEPAIPGGPAPDPGPAAGYEVPRTFPLPDLRDQLVGAVLDGRMDLALDLHRRWRAASAGEVLPPGVEMEIANELLRRGAVAEAEEGYRGFLRAYGRHQDAPEAKFRLGLLLGRVLGGREEARAWLREAAAEHPDPATAAFARREIERLSSP
jgi:membrane associated rhomboid family serine protease